VTSTAGFAILTPATTVTNNNKGVLHNEKQNI